MKFLLQGVQASKDHALAFTWDALDGDGNVVARGPRSYPSERECRSSIGRARTAFQGARFAKVVTS